MGLLGEFLKIFSGSTPNEKDKQIRYKLLLDEAKAYGLTEEEIKECIKSGITPEEWVNDGPSKK